MMAISPIFIQMIMMLLCLMAAPEPGPEITVDWLNPSGELQTWQFVLEQEGWTVYSVEEDGSEPFMRITRLSPYRYSVKLSEPKANSRSGTIDFSAVPGIRELDGDYRRLELNLPEAMLDVLAGSRVLFRKSDDVVYISAAFAPGVYIVH